MLQRCPKLHRYWNTVVPTLNQAFQTALASDPLQWVLDILDDLIPNAFVKVAASTAVFQA